MTRMRSYRQPSLPGFPDIPDKMRIEIPHMPMWEQIGGDMDPGAHGGTLARSDGDRLELLKIQPVREYVGDEEAADVGFPFWTREASYDLSDLDPENEDVKSALNSIGMSVEQLSRDPGERFAAGEHGFTPQQRALVIAEALLDYGSGAEEGPSGWSEDIIHEDVKWWGDKIAGSEYIADEDEAFRQDVLGWGEIQSKLEEMVQHMVDESAAQGWSQIGDQDMMDLEAAGYEDQTAWSIAEFGDAIAVNTETTFGPELAKDIGVENERGIFIWSDVGTRELERWLEANGYEVTDRGGQVPGVEGYAYTRHVIQAVARELDEPIEKVTEAAKALDWWPKESRHGDTEIPGSADGHVTVWAKPLEREEEEEEEEELEERRRSTRRRR